MNKHLPQSDNMKALEQSLNDHMEICSLKRKVKRLKAELASLRASSFVTAVPVEQYERVIKAGDLLCFHYISLARKRWPDDPLPSSVTDWNAAKEGKGQP